jgi:hypothetical protein
VECLPVGVGEGALAGTLAHRDEARRSESTAGGELQL